MSKDRSITISGCPNFTALTFDTDGVIKVLKAENGRSGVDVVKTWGNPDRSKSVVAASLCDSLLAVARQDGQIELLDSISGEVCFTKTDTLVAGLHHFNKDNSDTTSRGRGNEAGGVLISILKSLFFAALF